MQQRKKVDRKRFVRYKEGAELYSMCQSKFEDMARDAGAIYKLNKLVLVMLTSTYFTPKNPLLVYVAQKGDNIPRFLPY